MSESEASKAAKILSKLGSSKGGLARAEKMSPEQRKEIAQKAADVRWGIPEALFEGELRIGELIIPCAVLEDSRRVLSETGVLNSLGLYRSGAVHIRARDATSGAHLPLFLAHKNLKPFIDSDLEDVLLRPIWLKPLNAGSRQKGVDAQLIPRICEVWLRARDAGVLGKRQELVAAKADILMRGLATVGIIALVDEATGYQNVRARRALEQILEAYISDQLLKWAKTFPDDFYKEIFRLKGWNYSMVGFDKRPQVIGRYTKDIVYARLAPFVLEELERLNPSNEKGRRKHKHFQWLTDDIGHPKLKEHLVGVIALMKASSRWDDFRAMLRRVYPRCNEQLDLIYVGEDERKREEINKEYE
jgi:hypothetical protein